MKKILCMFLVMGTLVLTVKAQDEKMPERPKGKMGREKMEKMKEHRDSVLTQQLKAAGATDEQIAKAKEANEVTGKQLMDLRKDESLSEDDKKDKRKALMQQQADKMKEILGEEKFKKFKELKKSEHKGEGEHEGHGNHGDHKKPVKGDD